MSKYDRIIGTCYTDERLEMIVAVACELRGEKMLKKENEVPGV